MGVSIVWCVEGRGRRRVWLRGEEGVVWECGVGGNEEQVSVVSQLATLTAETWLNI